VKDPTFMIKGREENQFGSDADREFLAGRDIAKNPFTDPTSN